LGLENCGTTGRRAQSRLAVMDAIPVDVYEGEMMEIERLKY
jgi:hypothetical protein